MRTFRRSITLDLELELWMILHHLCSDGNVLCLSRSDDRLVQLIEHSREVWLDFHFLLHYLWSLLAILECLLEVSYLIEELSHLGSIVVALIAEVIDCSVEGVYLILVALHYVDEVVGTIRCAEEVIEADIELDVRIVDVPVDETTTIAILVKYNLTIIIYIVRLCTSDSPCDRRLYIELPLLLVAEIPCEIESELIIEGVADSAETYSVSRTVARVMPPSYADVTDNLKVAWLTRIASEDIGEVPLCEEVEL